MSLWMPKPPLLSGENILWKKGASLSLRTTVGGTLYYTNQRLLMVPNGLNFFRETRMVRSWNLADIVHVGIKEKTYTAYDGGFQRRMEVVMRNGEVALFVFRKQDLEEGIAELKRVVGLP